METLWSRLRSVWENMSRGNQIMLAALAAGTLIAGIGFIYWASTPDYVALVSNPSPQDSAAIIAQLKDRKVLYRISPDGTTIEVPSSQRAELRMSLAAAGLLNSGSLGYAALDKAPFGQTQAMEQQTIKRALEGEMENSIQSLEPVASARVKFAPGDDSMFVSPDRREPSASVLVHLKPGQELTKNNVRAIVNLVARAYTGLTPRNVSVVDGDGNLLWDGSQEEGPTVGLEERQAQERAYTDALRRQIQAKLTQVLGPNKSAVTVRADLDFDSKTEKRTEILPGVPVSQETSEQSLKGVGASVPPRMPVGLAANAAPGPVSPPTYASGSAGMSPGYYTQTQTVKTMANGKSETEIVKAPGSVNSLGVAILVDESVPDDTVRAITQDVATMIGADPANPASNRHVSVQKVPFDRSAQEAEKKAAQRAAQAEWMNKLIGYGVPVVLMLLILFVLARGLKRITTAALPALPGGAQPALAAAGAGAGGTVDISVGQSPEEVEALQGGGEEPRVLGLPTGEQVHTFEVISEAFDADLESIRHLAEHRPEVVAMLIKSWMAEDMR